MLMKNYIVKFRHALTLSSLFFLAACGGSSNDPTSAIYDVTFTGTWGAATPLSRQAEASTSGCRAFPAPALRFPCPRQSEKGSPQ